MSEPKKVDNYSILIVAKYLQTEQDYINLVCVCKNFKKTLKKFRYNPIPVHNTKLFPLMQTQFLYNPYEKRIEDVDLYRICYPISYKQYLQYQKEGNVKCSKVYYSTEDAQKYTGTFPEVCHSLGDYCFQENSFIESISFPSYITSLGRNCFVSCFNLSEVQLPPHLNSLPSGCMQLCYSLRSITLASSITIIPFACFYACLNLTHIDLPDNLKIIDSKAFMHCSSLSEINLPSSLEVIQTEAFSNCHSLKSIEFPSIMKQIFTKSFKNCVSLQSVSFPLTLENIYAEAFENCSSLTSFILPKSCHFVGVNTLKGCTSLKIIKYPQNDFGYCMNNISYDEYEMLKPYVDKFMRIEWNRNEIENGDVKIPNVCNWLGANTYEKSDVVDVVIPPTIRSIKEESFSSCSKLTSVIIPTSCTNISEKTFEDCSNLKEIILSPNLFKLHEFTFKNCSKLEHISIPETVTFIKYDCFVNCTSLKTVELPKKCIIQSGCFSGCTSLKKINLPCENNHIDYEITTDEYSIFHKLGYSCDKIIFKPTDSQQQIPNFDFKFSLGPNSYSKANFTEIVFPSNLTKIGEECFLDCPRLTSLTIPSTIVSIGNRCFDGCDKLRIITLPSTLTEIGDFTFDTSFALETIISPLNQYDGTLSMKIAFLFESYGIKCKSIALNTEDYKELGMIPPQVSALRCCEQNKSIQSIVIPTTIQNIQHFCFFECELLTRVSIPSTVTFIGTSAFSLCKKLKYITFDAQITRLEKYAFFHCDFETIQLPTTLKEIDEYAIGSCGSLTKLYIPSSVSKISDSVFQGCQKLCDFIIDPNIQLSVWPDCLFSSWNLTQIEFPTSITELADGVFDGCTSLQIVKLPNVKRINNNVFKNCQKLEYINLPTTLTHIGSFAFEKCFNLKEVNLPESVVSIGHQLVVECLSLTKITLSSSLEIIDKCLLNKCTSLKEIWIGNNKISKYPYSVSYEISQYLKSIKIQCEEIVMTREDINIIADFEKRVCDIPEDIKYLDDYLFRNNNDFDTISIPKSIVSIGKDCFKNCSAKVNENKSILQNIINFLGF